MKRDSVLRLLYGKLASIRTSVYILSVMAFFFMAGTIFPQGEKLEDYIKAGGRFVAFVKLFGLLDFFSSPLFLISAFVLFLNLAVCTYERFFAIRSPRRYPKEFTSTHSITLTQDEAEAVTETRRVLRDELGFRLVSKDNEWIVMEKGLPYRWLTWLYHAGIIICVIGVTLTFLLAYEDTVTLSPGKAVAVEPEAQGRLSSLAGEKGPSGFKIKVLEFLTEYAEAPELDYPEGGLSRLAIGLGWQKPRYMMKGDSLFATGWKARILVEEDGRAVKEKLVEINGPLKYGGYTFYLLDFDQAFKVRVENNPILLEAKNNEEMIVPGLDFPIKFSIFRTGKLKKLDGSIEEIRGHTNIKYAGEGQSKDEDLGRIETGESVYLNGTRLTLVDVVESPIMSYRYDPGMPLLWWGGILVLVAMSLRFFGSWHMAAYRIGSTGGIARLDARMASKGLFADSEKMAKRLEHYLTQNDIRPTPLQEE